MTKTAGEEVQQGDWQDAIGGAARRSQRRSNKEKRPLAADLSWLPAAAAAAAAAAAGEAFTPLPLALSS